MKTWYQSRRIRLFAALTAVFFALFSVLRLVFYIWFSFSSEPVDLNELMRAFYIGAKFDLRLTLIIILPLVVMGSIPKYGLGNRRLASALAIGYLTLSMVVVLLTYVFDFYHYDYLQQRMDASVLRFLDTRDNAAISAQMMWQSYPVIWSALVWLAGVLIMYFVITKIIRRTLREPGQTVSIIQRGIGGAIVFVCFVAGLYGQWSWFPLRWSNALFSENKFVSAVTLNPVLFFASTFKNRNRQFNLDLTRKHYPFVANYLNVDHFDPVNLLYDRAYTPENPGFDRKPNVIIFLLESLSTHWLGIQGNILKPTPNMDRLIRQSVYFKRNYVPRFGTARSTWALVTGIPDVSSIKTATRNPLIVNQHSLFTAFDQHEKYYFIGGNANWANIRGVLQQSIPGINIYEEGSYDEYPRVDAWGVSDLSVFEKAHVVLSKRDPKRPFVAYIQTAGNHSPYTIPEDSRGFVEKQASYKMLVSAAFASNPEYNGVRLLDHFIGEYFELLKTSSYAKDTIFAFFGDHGLPRQHNANMEMDQLLGIVELRAPMWIYAPTLGLQPRVIDAPTSLLDLMPSVAHIAGVPHRNTTMGRDLLGNHSNDEQSIFLMHKGVRGVDRIGYLDQNYYLGYDLDGQYVGLHDISNAAAVQRNLAQDHPDIAETLKQKAIGLYETAQYMLFHNSPKPHR